MKNHLPGFETHRSAKTGLLDLSTTPQIRPWLRLPAAAMPTLWHAHPATPQSNLSAMFRITAIVGLSLLSACASDEPLPSPKPTPLSGEQILRESQGMAQLGERYKQGESLMHEGESQVDQGKKLMAEGQRMIADGKRIMREAEQGYGEIKK
jgi:hypothetical protein